MRLNTLARSIPALAAAGALLTLVGCSGSSSAPVAAGAGTPSGSLAVGSDLTYPPYAYLSGKKPAGFDPEIARALAGAAGLKATFVDTRFEQLIAGLGTGHFDVIASDLYITDARKKQVDFIPYFTTGNSIVVRSSDGDKPSTAADLCGRSVAVIKGGEIVQKLRGDASTKCTAAGKKVIDVHEFTSDPEGTQALLSGQVDAQVTDSAVAKAAVDKTDGKLAVTSTAPLYPVTSGLAVKKGNSVLLKTLTKALDKLKSDGTYDELLKKYNLTRPQGS